MKVSLIVVCSLFLLMVSCKKKGCTDPSSINYSQDAEKDDESCTYTGYVVFWFNSVTATNLVNASIPNIDFYVDQVKEGTVSATQFSVSEPVCSGSEGYTATIDLGTSKSVAKVYEIKDAATGNVIQSGFVTVTNTPCKWIELNY